MPNPNVQSGTGYNEEFMGYRQQAISSSKETADLIKSLSALEAQLKKSNSNYKGTYFKNFTDALDEYSKIDVANGDATRKSLEKLFRATNTYYNRLSVRSTGNKTNTKDWNAQMKGMAKIATKILFASIASGRTSGKKVLESHADKSKQARYLPRSYVVDEAASWAKKIGVAFNKQIAYKAQKNSKPALGEFGRVAFAQSKEDILGTSAKKTSPILSMARGSTFTGTSRAQPLDNYTKIYKQLAEIHPWTKGQVLPGFDAAKYTVDSYREAKSQAKANYRSRKGEFDISEDVGASIRAMYGDSNTETPIKKMGKVKTAFSAIYNSVIKHSDVFAKTLENVGKVFEMTGKGIEKVGVGVGGAFAALGADNPLEMIQGVTKGLSSMTTMVSDFMSGVFGAIGSMLGSAGGGGKDGGGKGGGGKGGAGAALAIIGGVFSLISGAFSLLSSAISMSFSVFNGLLTGVLGTLKKMLKTSPIFDAILNILNLAFTLFFMPFFNVFSEALLPTVLNLLDWASQYGEIFSGILQETGIIGLITESVNTFVEDIKGIVTSDSFVQMITDLLRVIPIIFAFSKTLLEFFVGHSKVILDIISKGLDYLDEMLTNGIIDAVLDFSKHMLEWMGLHADDIAYYMEKIFDCVEGIAGIFGTVSNVQRTISNAWNAGASAFSWLHSPIGFANGGIVPATPGGTLGWIGEGGRSEAVIPLDEMDTLGGTKQIVIQFTGNVYGMNDFETKVQQIVNNTANRAYFR